MNPSNTKPNRIFFTSSFQVWHPVETGLDTGSYLAAIRNPLISIRLAPTRCGVPVASGYGRHRACPSTPLPGIPYLASNVPVVVTGGLVFPVISAACGVTTAGDAWIEG